MAFLAPTGQSRCLLLNFFDLSGNLIKYFYKSIPIFAISIAKEGIRFFSILGFFDVI